MLSLTDLKSFDSILVVCFFYFFGLLTFYYVGIQNQSIKQLIDKVKFLLKIQRKKPTKIPPELISNKYKKLSEFLTGKSKLLSFDISLSLFLTNVTPVILLAVPTTVYLQGAQYFASLISFPIAIMFANIIFVPVFYSLQVKTSNQVINHH